MIVYFDASALVKLVIEEDQSDLAAQVWEGASPAVSSEIAYAEVRAGLAAAHRDKRLDEAELIDAKRLFERFWVQTGRVAPTPTLFRAAGELAEQFSLRGYDAVHLASALTFRDSPLVASWDNRMRSGARGAGLSLVPS